MRPRRPRRVQSGRIDDFRTRPIGGSGQALDADGGLIITNGGKTVTLDTSTATTVEELLNLINGAGLGLAAEINATRTGINVRSRLSGADLTIGENGGTLATQLGIRTYTASRSWRTSTAASACRRRKRTSNWILPSSTVCGLLPATARC